MAMRGREPLRNWSSGYSYNQRYPTFARVIGANFAYVRLHINLGINLQNFGCFPSLDIGKILS